MSHSKNTITPTTLQARLVTQAAGFMKTTIAGEDFFSVTVGVLVSDALNEASTILGAVESVSGKLMDCELDDNDIYMIRFMISAAKALIDAGTSPVKFGNARGAK